MDLIVEDEYVVELADYIKKQCELIGEFIGEYIKILKEVVECGICEGDTAAALEEFIQQVKTNTAVSYSSYTQLGIKTKRLGSDFVSEIDLADGDLY